MHICKIFRTFARQFQNFYVNMKKYCFCYLLLTACLVGLITGCQEKINLSDIDTRSEVNVGLASPIGAIQLEVGDIMLNQRSANFFIGPDGTIMYQDTSHFSMSFDEFDWKKYANQSHKRFDVSALDIPGVESGIVLPAELKLPLRFDFALEMKNINIDPEEERFDSIVLDYIDLYSTIGQENMNLDWAWIDSIVIYLGPQCYREAGQNFYVYEKDDWAYDGYGFNKPLPSLVDNFSMCLMKDRSLTPGVNTLEEFNNNVVDTVKMQLGIYLTVPAGTQLTIQDDAAILYDLDFKGLEPQAVWGLFKPSTSMSLKDSIDIVGAWHIGEMLSEMRLPFAYPQIDFNITTQLAAAWELGTDMLYTTNDKGEKAWATFNGEHTWRKFFPNAIDLAPSTIGQSATYSFTLNNTDSLGHLDNLFTISPSRLVYQFGFDFADSERYPQIRIPAQTDIDVEMAIALPMAFNPNVNFLYTDTLSNIDLSALAVDPEYKTKTSIFILIDAYNELPINIVGDLRFLDENGTDLNLISEPICFIALDSTKSVIEFHEQEIEKLSSTKSILVNFNANDDELRDNKPEIYPIRITKTDVLSLQLGVTGNIDAVLNFNKK